MKDEGAGCSWEMERRLVGRLVGNHWERPFTRSERKGLQYVVQFVRTKGHNTKAPKRQSTVTRIEYDTCTFEISATFYFNPSVSSRSTRFVQT